MHLYQIWLTEKQGLASCRLADTVSPLARRHSSLNASLAEKDCDSNVSCSMVRLIVTGQ